MSAYVCVSYDSSISSNVDCVVSNFEVHYNQEPAVLLVKEQHASALLTSSSVFASYLSFSLTAFPCSQVRHVSKYSGYVMSLGGTDRQISSFQWGLAFFRPCRIQYVALLAVLQSDNHYGCVITLGCSYPQFNPMQSFVLCFESTMKSV